MLAYLSHNPIFTLGYIVAFFLPNLVFRPRFYTNDEFQRQIKKGQSLIRLGDGEIHIMNGGSIDFQKYEQKIDQALRDSIATYDNESPYILCINERVMNKSNLYLRKIGQLYMWLPTKVYFWLYFNKKASYFDASAFYYNNSFENLLGVFLAGKKIVLISKDATIQDFLKNQHGNSTVVESIVVPPQHAFDQQAEILSKLEKYKSTDTIILLSCGPAGKYIAYKLAPTLQCLDVGHGLELAYTSKDLEKQLVI